MRILHIRSSAGFYGAEAVIASLAAAQRLAGHQATVLSLYSGLGESDPLVFAMEAHGVDTDSLTVRGKLDLTLVARLSEYLRVRSVDLVHLHGYKEDLYGLPAARRAGVVALVTNHLWNGNDWKVRLYERLDAAVLRRYGGLIVAVSGTIRDDMVAKGVSAERIVVIPNAVPLAFLNGPRAARRESAVANEKEPFVVATCARLAPEKGHRFMLAAIRQLAGVAGRPIFWRVIGDGPLRGDLEREVQESGLTKVVSVEGYCTDIPAVLACVDAVVQPSTNEGMPIAVLEAMAAGVATIATAVGAVPELIEHGKTGILVPPADSGALARALDELRHAPERASQLGSAARDFVHAHFTPQRMAARYDEIYERALSRRH